MRNRFSKTTAGCVLAIVFLACIASAQAPAPGAPPAQAAPGAQASPVVANPTYVTIPMEITVNRPAAEAWKRVGKYCDIAEWLRITCTITTGKDGDAGARRSVAHQTQSG